MNWQEWLLAASVLAFYQVLPLRQLLIVVSCMIVLVVLKLIWRF
jgi:hypothetical protein